jgi:hypothetical protein
MHAGLRDVEGAEEQGSGASIEVSSRQAEIALGRSRHRQTPAIVLSLGISWMAR